MAVNASDRLRHLSPAKRALLLQQLQQSGEQQGGERIMTRPVHSPAAMSFAQQRLWLLDQIEGAAPTYNIPYAIAMSGQLDVAALTDSLSALVRRHEALRTTFQLIDGQPMQLVAEPQALELPLSDLRALTPSVRQERVADELRLAARRPFDLAHGPLLRVALLRLADEEHLLILVMHHIVSDAWSVGVLVRDLSAYYSAFVRGEPAQLAELPVQYADFAHWQRQWLEGAELERQLEYWKSQLRDLSVAELPTDYPRPRGPALPGDDHTRRLSPRLTRQLRELCQREGVTLFMAGLAALSVLLSRLTGQHNLTVGSPIANRNRIDTEQIIGFFVNTLVLRVDLAGNPSLAEVLQRAREVALKAYAHQDLPFASLVEALSPERDIGRTPLFQVMYGLQNTLPSAISLPGLALRPVEIGTGTTKFDLTIDLVEAADDLTLSLAYRTDLFASETALGLLEQLELVLEQLVASPQRSLSQVQLLSAIRRQQVLALSGPAATPYPEACLHELFAAQVARSPLAVAAICGDERLSYRELNRRANRLARILRARGIGPEVAVGICMERSLDLLVGLLAILKAGGAYVPLDPAYPAERLVYMLADSGAALLLTQPHLRDLLIEHDLPLIEIGADGWPTDAGDDVNLSLQVSPDNLAYVIYTSGSTGRPRGVMGLHRSTVNRLQWMWETYPFRPGELCCQKTALSFVDSVWETFGPLLRGVPSVLLPEADVRDTYRFVELIARHGVTRLVLVPALLRVLLEVHSEAQQALGGISTWVSSGEALPRELLELFKQRFPQSVLLNLYGSSEVAADATWEECTAAPESGSVPIGRPIANTCVYVLDNDMQLVPVGASGELYIGGAGLARGYLGRPELTAERFVPDPFSGQPGARLYRSGDYVRLRADGRLEYLERLDQQVKIRGHRVEIGEVEHVLRAAPGITDVAVVAHPDAAGQRRLVAYVVPEPPAQQQVLAPEFSLFYFAADEAVAERNKYELYLEGARFADQHGFAAVWTPERHFHEVAGLYPNPSVLNAALAMITERVALRAGSVVLPLHHPLRVAEEWAVVDNLSNGRVGLSFTSGWIPRDFAFAPDNFASKREVMFEGIEKVRRLWRGEMIEAMDGAGNRAGFASFPRPLQAELPVWLTCSSSPQMFAKAGELGVHVLTALLVQTVEEAAANIAIYRESLARHGHDPRAGRVTMMLHTYVADSAEQVIANAREPFCRYMRAHMGLIETLVKSLKLEVDLKDERALDDMVSFAFERYRQTASLIGTPESCLRMVQRMREIGVDEIACLIDFGVTTPAALASLAVVERVRQMDRATTGFDAPALKSFAAGRLPEYMVPGAYVALPALPRTPSGKLHRRALAAPTQLAVVSRQSYTAPRSPIEEDLAAIWSSVLNLERVSVHDSFFDLGGHSLLAAQLVARLRERFRVDLSVRCLFDAPTVAGLAQRIAELGASAEELAPPIVPVPRTGALVLSYTQEQLWILDQMVADSMFYSHPFIVRLTGRLDLNAIERTFSELVRRHEILRTTFHLAGQFPVQLIAPPQPFALPLEDVRPLAPAAQEELIRQIGETEARTHFDLGSGPLIRARLLRTGDEAHVLFLAMHHIITDGWSFGVLVREVSALYNAFVAQRPADLPDLPIQYADYAAWQRQWLQGAVLDRHIAYWKGQLAGAPPLLDLPTDRPRPPALSYSGASIYRQLFSVEETAALHQLCRDEQVTLFMALLAAFQIVLGRYAAQEDVCVGSPVAGRNHLDTEGLIGCFINTLVFRGRLAGNPSLGTVLRRVREVALGAYAHQELPFELLVKALQPERAASHTPIFQTLFILQNAPNDGIVMRGLELQPMPLDTHSSKYDLMLSMSEECQALYGHLEYSSDLFDEGTMEQFLEHFRRVVGLLVSDRDRCIADLALEPPLRGLHQADQLRYRGYPLPQTYVGQQLLGCPGVCEAALRVHDCDGKERLVAYVVPHEGHSLSEASIRQALGERLPEYMLPADYVLLAAMPRDVDGAVDPGQLAPPAAAGDEALRRDLRRAQLSESKQALLRKRLRLHGESPHGGNE